jgi:hypothetical protein
MNISNRKPAFLRQYFIYLLPVFFVLHGYQQNFPSVSLTGALGLTCQYLLIALALSFIFFWAFRSWQKAALFSFLLLGIQFFFGAIQDVLKENFPGSFISKYSFLLPFILALLVLAFVYLRKTDKDFGRLVRYLHAALILLILIDLFVTGYKALTKKDPQEPVLGFTICNDCPRPNIYLILADEYAGREELKKIFSFDNGPFEDSLRKRMFHVVSAPRSNYNFTPYSMASLFSMDYLKGITSRANEFGNQSICFQQIKNNELVRILEKFGYRFVNFSLFDFAGQETPFGNSFFYTIGQKLISSQTLTSRVKKDLSFHLASTLGLNWAKENFQNRSISIIRKQYDVTIAEAGKNSKQPRFVYTHFIMPHYPYLFDKEGRKLSWDQMLDDKREDLYLDYLQYANKKYLLLIDSILAKDRTNPVIIFMSDHGFTKYTSDQLAPIRSGQAQAEQLAADPSYNFQNIINIRLPDGDETKIPDTMTNVNLFRILLNTEFKQRLPILKDSTVLLKEY